jgi:NAD(P)-dependent dehydrogenase (short-subunit alcohol dehydrogenase family)
LSGRAISNAARTAAREIGAIGLQLDVTDRVSIADAAERIREEFGCLDLLVQNAAISNTRKGSLSLQDYARMSRARNASLDEVRTVWETNVFGAYGQNTHSALARRVTARQRFHLTPGPASYS